MSPLLKRRPESG